jgi:lysozyme family protein
VDQVTFDECFDELISHEGGFVDNSALGDRGGPTKYGVTQAEAREGGYSGPIEFLPISTARRIYQTRYWNRVRAEELPAELRYVVFDSAVNSGPNQAIRWLQHSLDVPVDGVLGPVTLKAAQECNTLRVTGLILAQRLVFMTNLPSWGSFSRGWARRIAKMLEEA